MRYIIVPCDENNMELIEYLTGKAVAQQEYFDTIYPWAKRCERGQYLYIALMSKGNFTEKEIIGKDIEVYGWMSVTVFRWHSRRVAHVIELSSRIRKDPSITGVGRDLMNMMEKHVKGLAVDFIKLLPLPGAIGFYKKLEYKDCLNGFLCKVLNKAPTKAYAKHVKQVLESHHTSLEDDMANDVEQILEQLPKKKAKRLREMIESDDSVLYTIFYLYEESGLDGIDEYLSSL